MKNYKICSGIDVSKSSLGFCVLDSDAKVLLQRKTGNDSKGIKMLLNGIKKS
jgi:hypothetical protein